MKRLSRIQIAFGSLFLVIFIMACSISAVSQGESEPTQTAANTALPQEFPTAAPSSTPAVLQIEATATIQATATVPSLSVQIEPADGVFPGVIRESQDGGWIIAIGFQTNLERCDDSPQNNQERNGCDLEVWHWYTDTMYADSEVGIGWFANFTDFQTFAESRGILEWRILFSESCRIDPMRPGECWVQTSNLHLLDADLGISDGVIAFSWDVLKQDYCEFPVDMDDERCASFLQ